MDNSETYIKMCQKAEEIQRIWQNDTPGDFWYDPASPKSIDGSKIGFEVRINPAPSFSGGRVRCFWLPRQDQLQEMVTYDFLYWEIRFYPSTQRFNESVPYEFCVSSEHYYVLEASSMEQLWLAFVMKEKFGKVWSSDKGDWVKET